MGIDNPAMAANQAIFAIAEIKATVDAFDRGEANVFDALLVAVEGYKSGSPLIRDVA